MIHVCTPNDSHAAITIAALEAGKHVMSEKPMAKMAADAKRMAETAKKTGKKLTVGYQSRHRPDSQYLYKACRAANSATSTTPKLMPCADAASRRGACFGRREAGRRAAD